MDGLSFRQNSIGMDVSLELGINDQVLAYIGAL
jgi:hypothetical protein